MDITSIWISLPRRIANPPALLLPSPLQSTPTMFTNLPLPLNLLISLAFFLVSIRRTRLESFNFKSLFRALTIHGFPNPRQFQLKSLMVLGRAIEQPLPLVMLCGVSSVGSPCCPPPLEMVLHTFFTLMPNEQLHLFEICLYLIPTNVFDGQQVIKQF
ncbi:hypothetical protein PIB30_023284 [Stylosanthes scabra]|uniref:Uncharacterized protein n=1 Tax=Stylosanthes scabra TaxID=79078 RepID=A0ABU6Z9V5_9FABA|nr:hypothetical protein [Stylosanthes scabra]